MQLETTVEFAHRGVLFIYLLTYISTSILLF